MVNTGPLIKNGERNYQTILTEGSSNSILYGQAQMVMSDPYYSSLYKRVEATSGHLKAVEAIDTAGCHYDRLETRPALRTDILTAPYNDFKPLAEKVIVKGKTPAIVLSSGSFDPLHTGHIETLVRAKEYLEATGNYEVIAGLLSGGHDTYVRMKNPGGVPALERFKHNSLILKNHKENIDNWIHMEAMESLVASVPMNFTYITDYVATMCKEYVGEVKVFFIFGSDNAGFSLAFSHENNDLADAICVSRPGYEIPEELWMQMESFSSVHYTEGFSDESSTHVRQTLKNSDIEELVEEIEEFETLAELKELVVTQ